MSRNWAQLACMTSEKQLHAASEAVETASRCSRHPRKPLATLAQPRSCACRLSRAKNPFRKYVMELPFAFLLRNTEQVRCSIAVLEPECQVALSASGRDSIAVFWEAHAARALLTTITNVCNLVYGLCRTLLLPSKLMRRSWLRLACGITCELKLVLMIGQQLAATSMHTQQQSAASLR